MSLDALMIALFTIILAILLVAGGILIVQKGRRFLNDTPTNELKQGNLETLPLDTEVVQTQYESEQKLEQDLQELAEPISHGHPPQDRGGKPRRFSDKDDIIGIAIAKREKRPSLRPEVICWKGSRKWFVGIEIQEEYHDVGGIVVTQNGNQIEQNDRGRWVLLQDFGVVEVSWDEIGYKSEINLDNPYIVFRLAGQKVNRGRRVRYATIGSYLVIVPDHWVRDEEISGVARLSPESVCIDGLQAHYFLLEKGGDDKIGFLTSLGESIAVDIRRSRFELIGSQLADASEDFGPLFSEYPPKIKAIDQKIWRSIKTIVVGQEGSGNRRWRSHFAPEPERTEQIFPHELNYRRGGWYFVRFYDLEDALVESMDFRFSSDLKNIVVHHHSPLPGPDGHLPIPIKFVHNSTCTIRLAEGGEELLQIQRTRNETIALIPSNPVWDRTRWSIDIENRTRTDAVILVERVWWALGDEDVAKVQPHWSDKPIFVEREAFSATSKQILWLRLPRERWAETVQVGFTRENSRTYLLEVTKKYAAIPLSEFVGTRELEDKFSEQALKLWILTKDQNRQYVTVIKTLPEKQNIQIGNRPTESSRLRPELTTTEQIPPSFDLLALPEDRKCCGTCSFATINDLGIHCVVGTWEERVDQFTFYYKYSTYLCSRWQGEYRGPKGTMISE